MQSYVHGTLNQSLTMSGEIHVNIWIIFVMVPTTKFWIVVLHMPICQAISAQLKLNTMYLISTPLTALILYT